MIKFIVLYKKDIKRIYPVMFFLILLYGGYYLIHLTGIAQSPTKNIFFLFYILTVTGFTWLAPFLIAFTLYEEWKDKTLYQLFSLPAKRYVLMLSKCLTAFTVGIITSFGTIFSGYLMARGMSQRNINPEFFYAMIRAPISVLWLLGIVCITGSILFSIRKYRLLTALIMLPSLLFITIKIDSYISPFFYHRDLISSRWLNNPNQVWLFIGIIFLISGSVIFERYSEV